MPGIVHAPSRSDLELLEAVEFRLDPRLVEPRRALADPGPLPHQQRLLFTIRLEVNGGDDFVAYQHRQREITHDALVFGHIGLEAVLVTEKQAEPLALNDQRIEGRQNVNQIIRRNDGCLERCGLRPMPGPPCALDSDRHKTAAAEFQKIVATDLPTISLTTNVALIAKLKALKNFVPNPTNMTNFVDTSAWYIES